MAQDKRLIEYISQNLQMGYDQTSISQALLSSGYSQEQINAAFDYLYAQSQYGSQPKSQYTKGSGSHNIFASPVTIISGVLGVIIIGIFAVLLFSSNQHEDSFIIPPQQEIPVTTPIQLEEESQNDSRDDDIEQTDVVPIPVEEEVESQPTTQPPQQEEEQITSRPPTQSTGFTAVNPTRAEIDRNVDELAPTNPSAAINLCSEITTRSGRSSCYTRVALTAQDPQFCQEVEDLYPRDQCYMRFAVEEIGSIQTVCPNIHDRFTQRSCTLLYQNFAQGSIEDTVVEEPALSQSEIDEFYATDEEIFLD